MPVMLELQKLLRKRKPFGKVTVSLRIERISRAAPQFSISSVPQPEEDWLGNRQ